MNQESRIVTLEEAELINCDFDAEFVDLDHPELCKRRVVNGTPYVAVCSRPHFFWTALRKDGKPIDDAIKNAGVWTSYNEIERYLKTYHSETK
jgi:hypothetical protein